MEHTMNKTRSRLTTLALAFALSAGATITANAEQVTIPVGSQAERSQTRLPVNGMNESTVEDRWGTPQKVVEPVGQPPISQWHYQEFVVYFENNRVLHTVMKRER
jgi:hypothetical protein